MSAGWVTRTLAFNGYRFGDGDAWLGRVDRAFDAARLDALLGDLVAELDAVIIERSATQYKPRGASAAMLIGQSAFAHLAESHVAIHTYPDHSPAAGLAMLRLECEISSCGPAHPDACLPLLIELLAPELVTLDRRARGLIQTGQRLAPASQLAPARCPPGYTSQEFAGSLQVLQREHIEEPVRGTVAALVEQFG